MNLYYPNGSRCSNVEDFLDFYSKGYYLKASYIDEKTIEAIISKDTYEIVDACNILRLKCGKKLISNISENHEFKLPYSGKVLGDDVWRKIIEAKEEYCKTKDLAEVFTKITEITGIGVTYGICILYFISRKKYPIYDRFARAALTAIQDESVSLNDHIVNPKLPTGWSDVHKMLINYQDEIQCCFPWEDISDRRIDRALWTYGHMFTVT